MPTREVKQFHFLVWPDHGVPQFATPLLSFRKRVAKYHPDKKGPMVVHCRSALSSLSFSFFLSISPSLSFSPLSFSVSLSLTHTLKFVDFIDFLKNCHNNFYVDFYQTNIISALCPPPFTHTLTVLVLVELVPLSQSTQCFVKWRQRASLTFSTTSATCDSVVTTWYRPPHSMYSSTTLCSRP